MHNKIKGRKLGRTASHRKALLRNLANQIIEHKEIRTTTAKAKEARSKIERLITYAKKGELHHRRLAFAFLRNKQSINTLFDEIAPVYSDRQGGYTRIIKLGKRSGDGADISLLQLVDFEKLGDSGKSEKKKATKKKDKVETKKTEEVAVEEIEQPEAEEKDEKKADQIKSEPEIEAKDEAIEEQPETKDSVETEDKAESEEKK